MYMPIPRSQPLDKSYHKKALAMIAAEGRVSGAVVKAEWVDRVATHLLDFEMSDWGYILQSVLPHRKSVKHLYKQSVLDK
jgi:hypothetical protein